MASEFKSFLKKVFIQVVPMLVLIIWWATAIISKFNPDKLWLSKLETYLLIATTAALIAWGKKYRILAMIWLVLIAIRFIN